MIKHFDIKKDAETLHGILWYRIYKVIQFRASAKSLDDLYKRYPDFSRLKKDIIIEMYEDKLIDRMSMDNNCFMCNKYMKDGFTSESCNSCPLFQAFGCCDGYYKQLHYLWNSHSHDINKIKKIVLKIAEMV